MKRLPIFIAGVTFGILVTIARLYYDVLSRQPQPPADDDLYADPDDPFPFVTMNPSEMSLIELEEYIKLLKRDINRGLEPQPVVEDDWLQGMVDDVSPSLSPIQRAFCKQIAEEMINSPLYKSDFPPFSDYDKVDDNLYDMSDAEVEDFLEGMDVPVKVNKLKYPSRYENSSGDEVGAHDLDRWAREAE